MEEGGQNHAGEWTKADELRLRSLVEHAHANGLWIRFYTLDGASDKERSCNGWVHGYDFGALSAAEVRWKAAWQDGVDYLASDQYERVAQLLKTLQAAK